MTKAVKNLSVMRTEESDKHLKILMEAHGDQSTATREALKLAARILEYAWIAGFAERGTVPQMLVQYKVKPSARLAGQPSRGQGGDDTQAASLEDEPPLKMRVDQWAATY